jgi:hypothetical protein
MEKPFNMWVRSVFEGGSKRMTAAPREGGPTIEERVVELKAEGKKEDEIKLILLKEYSEKEVKKSGFLKEKEKPLEAVSPEEKTSFEERLKKLEASGMSKHDICRTLVLENYNNRLIVAAFGGLYAKVVREIKEERAKEEDSHLAALAGTAKGEGYLDEQKARMRHEFSRDTVVMKFIVDLGWMAFFAGLSKTDIPPEKILAMASEPEGFQKAMAPVGETVTKALECYPNSAATINKLEDERDEARAAYILLKTQVDDLAKRLTPSVRLEKMISAYILSGNFNPEALSVLLEKWLAVQVMALRKEVIPP